MTTEQFYKAWEPIEAFVVKQAKRMVNDKHPETGEKLIRFSLPQAHHEVKEHCKARGIDMCNRLPAWLSCSDSVDELAAFWKSAALFTTVTQPQLNLRSEDNTMEILRVNAPHWFKDENFVKWLNSERTATWHVRGLDPDEYSDAFFTWCCGDGSDSPANGPIPSLPQWVWEEVGFLVAQKYGWEAEVLVWVSNLK